HPRTLHSFPTRRSSDLHRATQDIQDLGEFIDTAGTNNLANWSYPVIMSAGGESGHAVLLGVHPHAAELENLELSAVLGQAHLFVDRKSTRLNSSHVSIS